MSTLQRKATRPVRVSTLEIGGQAPITVQSMTNTNTRNVVATTEQIRKLEDAGAEIIRVAVPDIKAAEALPDIIKEARTPIVADIHFDYRLALSALKAGVHKLRINPGNIGSREKTERVLAMAKDLGVPIRIGVNSGSVHRDLLAKYGGPVPEALVESALEHVAICEALGFEDLVISLKMSDALQTVAAYRIASEKVQYPLHLGITEAGLFHYGSVKSAIGLGILLAEGIGDTMRVSLSADPVEEVAVAFNILKALGLRHKGIELISCPTCGRTEIDLISLAGEVERRLMHIKLPLKIAVMGCVVNGPGEARVADFGIAGGRQLGIIFKKGVVVKKVPEELLLDEFIRVIEDWITEKGATEKKKAYP